MSFQIKDYHRLVDQISRVLRPGGLLNVVEFDFHAYDCRYQRINLDTSTVSPPWWPRWLAYVELAVRNAGGDVEAATHLRSWISNHSAFEDVVYRDYFLPSCPWLTDSDTLAGLRDIWQEDIAWMSDDDNITSIGDSMQEDIVVSPLFHDLGV